MKKLLSLTLAFASVSFFFSCQRNNYTTQVPAPTFSHVQPENSTKGQTLESAMQEQVAAADLYASADNGAVTAELGKSVPVTSRVSQASTTNKAVTVTNTTAPKKLTLKERMMTKMVTKRVQKMASIAKPKADKTNTVALIGGIAGVLGLILLFVPGTAGIGLLLALGAIILGFIGKGQINRNGDRGKGWAIIGIITGFLVYFIVLLGVILAASILGGLI